MIVLILLLSSFDWLSAVVEREAITHQEIQQLSRLYRGVPEEDVLNKMIMGRVIRKAAFEESLTVSQREIINAKNRMLEQMPALENIFNQPYLDSLYTEELKVQLYTKKLANTKFRDRINITPTIMRQFYETHKDSIALPERVTLERISVPASKKEQQRVYKKAENILSMIESKEIFRKLAERYSDDKNTKYNGGELGRFRIDDLPPHLYGVNNLNEGESDIFKSSTGYHVVMMKDRGPEGFKLAHIFLKFDLDEEKLRAGEKNALEIRKRWIEGDSSVMDSVKFIGTIPVKSMGISLSSVIDTLDVCEVSFPILEGANFHLLHVVERKEKSIPEYEEVKERIRNLLYEREIQKLLEKWYERVKDEIYVKKL